MGPAVYLVAARLRWRRLVRLRRRLLRLLRLLTRHYWREDGLLALDPQYFWALLFLNDLVELEVRGLVHLLNRLKIRIIHRLKSPLPRKELPRLFVQLRLLVPPHQVLGRYPVELINQTLIRRR